MCVYLESLPPPKKVLSPTQLVFSQAISWLTSLAWHVSNAAISLVADVNGGEAVLGGGILCCLQRISQPMACEETARESDSIMEGGEFQLCTCEH